MRLSIYCLLLVVLAACGGGGAGEPATFTVAGAVTGLTGSVVLQNNGGDDLSVSANGKFVFTTPVASGDSYAVTILTQPAGQTCVVSAGSGVLTSDVSTVTVSCTTNTYVVGGTVSGLIRPVVLQDNLGDNLTIASDGAFSFATAIASGSGYSVTVLTQPAAQTCEVTGGSGTVTAKVTTVVVTCTIDASAAFLPLVASPVQGTTGGTTGIFVIPTTLLTSSPTLITASSTNNLGYVLQYTLDALGNITAASPFALAYTTLDSSGGDHVYTVGLSATSNLVASQISSLTFPYRGSTQTCGETEIFQDLTDPKSAFLILPIPTDLTYICGGGPASFNWTLIHLSDSATTAPISLPSLSGPLQPLYRPDGKLAGILELDSSHNLNFYPDQTFTNPLVLLRNVYGYAPIQSPSISPLATVSANPTYCFIAASSSAGTYSLYRLDYSGTLSADLYDFQGSYGYPYFDANNLYITDTSGPVQSVLESVIEVPLGGTSPAQVLYTFSSTTDEPPSIVGLSGGKLVIQGAAGINPTTQLVMTTFETLATNAPGTPTTIASYAGPASVVLAYGDLLGTLSTSTGSALEPFSYSTQALDLNGTVLSPVTLQSSFMYSNAAPWFEIQNITDIGNVGGGAISVLDLSTPASPVAVPLHLPSGAAYTVPPGTVFAYLTAVSATVGMGHGEDDTQVFALAYDLATDVIVPITMPNTNLNFLGVPY